MHILVVDDEQDVQVLFEQRFRHEIRSGACKLSFALSGEAALAYLQQNSHEALLVLSDINMPGMSGLELLERIKAQYVAPPPVVMMISAYGDDNNYQAALRLGAAAFLTKPVDFTQLKEQLKTIQ